MRDMAGKPSRPCLGACLEWLNQARPRRVIRTREFLMKAYMNSLQIRQLADLAKVSEVPSNPALAGLRCFASSDQKFT
ncbi:MAG TPA: hypothetical protein VMM15_42595 [Bradyrhizobium sp.]|nr:hypothetical protein [Bradyrhizobium sp.]